MLLGTGFLLWSQTAGAGGLKLAKWVAGTLLPIMPGLSMSAPDRATGLMR